MAATISARTVKVAKIEKTQPPVPMWLPQYIIADQLP
jgi:hypothetical protein